MTRFQLTQAARDDLAEILGFIADDDLGAAMGFKARLADTFERLARTPGMGHKRDDLTDRDVRFWPVDSYLVIYNPTAKPLQIIRVLSGFRDVADILTEK